MNIWLLTTEYPPFYGGGIASYTKTVSDMLARAGHQVTVFVQNKNQGEIVEKEAGVRVIRYASNSIAKNENYFNYLSGILAQRVMQQLNADDVLPDIIEVQDVMGLGYYLLQKKYSGENCLTKIPIIVHLHTPIFEVYKANLISQYDANKYFMIYREKWSIIAADGLICPSHFLAGKMAPLIENKDMKYIAVPLHQWIKRDYQQDDVIYDFFLYGRFEYRKGFLGFLNAVEFFWKQGKRIRVGLAGTDCFYEQEDSLMGKYFEKKYAEYIDQGLLKIYYRPENTELYNLIIKARVVVIPSYYENFPSTCIEAMSMGKPVLVSKSGGQAEMVGKEAMCGLVFDWSIDRDIESKIEQMFTMSENALKKIGRAAAVRVNDICNHADNVIQRIDYFQSIINKQKNIKDYPFLSGGMKRNSTNILQQKLTIIVIVAGHQATRILPTLRSCLLSGYAEKEVIIVNNGVTNNKTLEVLSEIEKAVFPGVITERFAEKKNTAFMRNYYGEKLTSEYICFLESGELVGENYFNKAITMLKNYDNLFFVAGNFPPLNKTTELYNGLNPELPWLFFANVIMSGVVYNRVILSEHGTNNEKLTLGYEEYESVLQLVLAGYKGVTLTEENIWTKNNKSFSLFDKATDPSVSVLFQSLLNKMPEITIKKYAVELLKIFNMVKYSRGKN